MKPKLFIVILFLIIVPTIFLSIMAARALSNWDTVLQKRLQAQAYTSAADVKDRVDAMTLVELEKIIYSTRTLYAKGEDLSGMDGMAKELEESEKLISSIYLFMNPWSFIYPPCEDLSLQSEQVLLTLRDEIASASSPTEPICFTVGSSSYCFGLVSMRGLYAGYEIKKDTFYNQLQEVLKKSATDLVVYAESDNLLIMSDKQINIIGGMQGVVVEDPFGGLDVKPPHESVIAEMKLRSPFENITIKAKVRDEEKLRKIATVRRSVYGWVILLLVFGIVFGAIIIWRSAVMEIRKASIKSNYVAGVSHDLRTPLASMKLLTETLLNGNIKDANKKRKFLEVISKEIERLDQLVERVLFFVRYGQDALVFKLELIDVASLINRAIEIMGERLCVDEKDYGNKGENNQPSDLAYKQIYKVSEITTIEVNVNIEDNLPHVELDISAMMQVIFNLLDNAVKYSITLSEKLEQITIDVQVGLYKKQSFFYSKEWVLVTICDYGIGIEKKSQHKIFERFYRSPRAINYNVSGVGLGLSLCQHIVKAHGGKITVESKIDKGSKFSIYIPVL